MPTFFVFSTTLLTASPLALPLALTGCGDTDGSPKDPTTMPAFLLVAPRVTAAPDGEPKIIDSLELRITGCAVSPERTESINPGSNGTVYLGFVLADAGCSFELSSLTLLFDEDGPAITFGPQSSTLVSGDQRNVKGRLMSEDGTKTLVGQMSTTYEGNFNQNAELLLNFGYENVERGLGLERRRIDRTSSFDTDQTQGVGLRVEGMILKRAPDGSGIIAIEPRLGCYDLREANLCMGRRLEDYEFIVLLNQENPPNVAQLDAAFADPSKITPVTSENLFGNGLYALVSTPERLPADNNPPTTLWLLVRINEAISAFELSTEGLRIF
jgi:hypothetical protein